jgi:hypothetical protein
MFSTLASDPVYLQGLSVLQERGDRPSVHKNSLFIPLYLCPKSVKT